MDFFTTQSLLLITVTAFIVVVIIVLLMLLRSSLRHPADFSLKLTDVINASLDAVVVLDKNGYVVDWNKNATTIFGYERDEVINKKLSEFIIPHELREKHTKAMHRFKINKSSKIMDRRLEMPALHKQGHTFPVELIITYARKGKNKYFFIGFLKDLSAFKKIQQESIKRNNIIHFLDASHRKFINELFYVERQALFEDILQGIIKLTESDYGFIGEVIYKDDKTPYLKTYALSNISWNEETRLLYETQSAKGMEFHNLKTLFGVVMVSGQIVISNNPSTDVRASGIPKGHPPLNAFLGVPLGEKDNLIGMIGLANRKEGYSEEILQMMNSVWLTVETMIRAYRDFKAREKYTYELASAEKLLLSEKLKLSSIIEGTHLATWEWNIQSNELIINKQWAEMIGYTIEELSPISIETWEKFTNPDDLKKAKQLLEQHFNGVAPNYDCEFRMRHKNGYWIWIHAKGQVSSWSNEGKPLVMFGIHQNITDRKFAEEQAYHRANYDPVTDLPSRRFAEDSIIHLIEQSERNKKKLAILYADLDNYKPVNDAYGHDVGDRLLKAVGDRLKSLLRKSDLVSRIGGDEFLIILDSIDSIERIEAITNKIIKSISDPYIIDKHKIVIGMSIGIAIYPMHGHDTKTLIMLADNAMYFAKKKGKNQFSITDGEGAK